MRDVILNGRTVRWDDYVDSMARKGLEATREAAAAPEREPSDPRLQSD